jgi:hypothetical protein
VFLKLYLLYRGSTRGFSFSIYAESVLFVSTKIQSKEEQRISADPNSAAPAATCRVAAVLGKAVAVKGGEPLQSTYQTYWLVLFRVIY